MKKTEATLGLHLDIASLEMEDRAVQRGHELEAGRNVANSRHVRVFGLRQAG